MTAARVDPRRERPAAPSRWRASGGSPPRRPPARSCSRTARAPTGSERPGGRLAERSSTASSAPPRAHRGLQCRPARRWARGARRGACGRTTQHRGRASGGHRSPPATSAPRLGRAARRRGCGRALSDRAALAVWLMMAAYAAALLVAVGAALPRLLDRTLRPRQHGPGGLEHLRGPPARDDRHHRAPVLAPRARTSTRCWCSSRPLWWVWSSPEMLLVAQAVIVASGALPGLLARAALARRRPAGARGRGGLPALSRPCSTRRCSTSTR